MATISEYFQTCILKSNEWQKANNMSFNNSKFQLLQYGRNTELRENYNYLSPDFNEVICGSSTVKDLGVYVSNSGNYNCHIDTIYKKAKQISMLSENYEI